MHAAQALKDVMGPDTDIPGPEISAGSRVMSWWFDEYSKYKGFSPACVTGARHAAAPVLRTAGTCPDLHGLAGN
jgi:glutamate dehydrogenase/leucine dehydrogenase